MVMVDSRSESATFSPSHAGRELICGGIAAALGESLMHPVDTVKTRMQSGGSFLCTVQQSTKFSEVLKVVLKTDGVRGLYRGIAAGMTGSFATGATYFGLIELTRLWINEHHPTLEGPVSQFCAGAFGDTVGSVIYVPCEVIKQRMQIQGSQVNWEERISRAGSSQVPETQYYRRFSHAAASIVEKEGLRGLYTGFGSTLGRDVPFAGLMIVFYEGLAKIVKSDKDPTNAKEFAVTGFEDLVIGGFAGGLAAFLTTPFDVIKTRLQVQGCNKQYKGWQDAIQNIWKKEGFPGLWKGSLPRVMWYVPASAVTFMAWQALRNIFVKPEMKESIGLSIESNSHSIDSSQAR